MTSLYGATSLNIEVPNGTTFEGTPITQIIDEEDMDTYSQGLYEFDDNNDALIDEETGEIQLSEGSSIRELENGKFQITYNDYEEVPVTINIQEILDGILPQLIPLTLTLLLYFMFIKRNWTPLKAIGFLLVLGLLGSGFGLWPSIW